MKAGKKSEQAIMETCHCDAQALLQGRMEQAMIILASLLDWSNCTTCFYPGQNLISYKLNLKLALPESLVTAARRALKNRRIQLASELMEGALTLDRSLLRKDAWLPLNKEENYICSLLNEPTGLADLLPLVPAGESSPEELVMRLFLLGLIKSVPVAVASSGSNPVLAEIDEMLISFEKANAYEILSVKTDAQSEDIQASYHELAKRFHPDRFQSSDFTVQDRAKAEQLFTMINNSYSILRDPQSRANYNETRLAKESVLDANLKAKAAKSEEEAQAEILFQEGRASLTKGDFKKAVEQLKSCVWFNPKKASYNYYLGMAESEIPELRKSAEQHFLKALELESAAADIHLALAKLYIKVMLPRKAEMQAKEALKWDPQNAEAKKILAEMEKAANVLDGVLRWKR
jgi:curved DNA-binding protein CbpA